MTVNEIFGEAMKLSAKDQKELYNKLGTWIKSSAQASFRKGDKVRFTSSKGEVISGTVTRVNQKTVSMRCDDGIHGWRVSPTLLEKVA